MEAEQAPRARDDQSRIAEAKEVILRDEHGMRLDHPLPSWAHPKTNEDALQSKAEVRFRQDYDQRVAVIKSDELDRYRGLDETMNASRERLKTICRRSRKPARWIVPKAAAS